MSLSIQQHDFDVSTELNALRAANKNVGALVSFVGLVRDFNGDDSIENLTLEHYPGMSEKALSNILDQAHTRWNLIASRVIHRIGTLLPNEQIVFVATAAAHRSEAFSAAEFIMDYLKTDAPFWKKEQTRHGSSWLEMKTTDTERAARWKIQDPGENT